VRLPIVIAYDPGAPQEVTAGSRELGRLAAELTGGTAVLAGLDEDGLADLRAWLRSRVKPTALTTFDPTTSAPMSSAPFELLEDGRPDWGAMWTTFCELALYGGPPHRGEDSPVLSPADGAGPLALDLLDELQRGIFETTGLQADATEGAWLAVRCDSKRMAAWMSAAIILENVDSRCDGGTLFLPAANGFELKNEIKSLITVVAKVNHYWQAHLMGKEPLTTR
jgi:sirohydrochlorin cobaltochelatase